jgi:hypothetical protein
MYQVTTDQARNLILITFLGQVGPAEVAEGRVAVIAALAALQPGFRLLTDLTGLEAMEYACAPEIETTMDLYRLKGVAEVVRVVPDARKDIGFTVMSYFHFDPATPVRTFASRAEALEKLSA